MSIASFANRFQPLALSLGLAGASLGSTACKQEENAVSAGDTETTGLGLVTDTGPGTPHEQFYAAICADQKKTFQLKGVITYNGGQTATQLGVYDIGDVCLAGDNCPGSDQLVNDAQLIGFKASAMMLAYPDACYDILNPQVGCEFADARSNARASAFSLDQLSFGTPTLLWSDVYPDDAEVGSGLNIAGQVHRPLVPEGASAEDIATTQEEKCAVDLTLSSFAMSWDSDEVVPSNKLAFLSYAPDGVPTSDFGNEDVLLASKPLTLKFQGTAMAQEYVLCSSASECAGFFTEGLISPYDTMPTSVIFYLLFEEPIAPQVDDTPIPGDDPTGGTPTTGDAPGTTTLTTTTGMDDTTTAAPGTTTGDDNDTSSTGSGTTTGSTGDDTDASSGSSSGDMSSSSGSTGG